MPIHSPLSRASPCSGPSGLPPAPLPIGRRFFFLPTINTYAQNIHIIIHRENSKSPKKNNSAHISTIKKSAQTYVYIRDSFTTFAYILSISCSKTWFFSKKQEILPSKSLFAKMLQLIRMENSNSLSLYAVLSFNKKF